MPARNKPTGKGSTRKPAKRAAKPGRKTARKQARRQVPEPARKPAGKRKPGMDIERGIEDFAEEMEWHGKRLEKHGKRLEKRARSWWYTTFGPVGPLIQSLVGIAVIGIIAILVNIVNIVLASLFVESLVFFIMDYLPVFLIIFLFFNYIKYIYYNSPKSRLTLRPLEAAGGITVMLWLFAWVLLLAHQTAEIGLFQRAANWIFPNLWNIFVIVLVIAYLGAIMVHSKERIANDGGKKWQ